MTADEALDGGGGVHVRDGDDRHAAVRIDGGHVSIDLFELLPALLDLVDVGHVGHGAARREVREDDRLLRPGQQVGGLGHEVHAAEDDRLGIGVLQRGVRELEGVADVVRVGDDLFALIEVPEHDDAVSERVLGGADACVELGVARLAILGGQLALPGRAGGDHVAHRRAGAVAGSGIDLPRAVGEVCRARVGRVGAGDDALDEVVDGSVGGTGLQRDGGGGHGVLSSLDGGGQMRAPSGPRSASSTSRL